MANRTGYLTIYSPNRGEIYGEFADADWTSESTDGGTNDVFTGTASDSTLDAFHNLNEAGISHVSYIFEHDGVSYTGIAELLAPIENEMPGRALIRIETGEMPIKA